MKKLLLFALVATSLTAQAQLNVTFAPAMTNKYLGGELQVGYRKNNTFISTGYIAMLHNSQPALFNVRGGVIVKERALLYAGYVRHHKSNHDKWLNYDTWQLGGQYHFCFYDKGTFFITCTYTNPGFTTVGVGMSYNLFQ